MKRMSSNRLLCMSGGMAAFVLATGQIIAAAQSPRGAGSADRQTGSAAANQSVTVTGCIQREADYRRSVGAGRGSAGTGAGLGNEFVLTNALMTTPGSTSAPPTTSTTGTTGSTGTAYELTGSHEGDAGALVGKRVEITGTLKPMDTPAGGPTASVPGSQDLKLRELEVSTVRETTGSCASSTTP